MERFIFPLSLADNTQFYTIFLTIFLRKRKEKYFMCNVNTFLAHKNSRRIMSGLPATNALNMYSRLSKWIIFIYSLQGILI